MPSTQEHEERLPGSPEPYWVTALAGEEAELEASGAEPTENLSTALRGAPQFSALFALCSLPQVCQIMEGGTVAFKGRYRRLAKELEKDD